MQVPALFGSGGGVGQRSWLEAFGFTQRPPDAAPHLPLSIVSANGFADNDETLRAEANVLVAGHVLDTRAPNTGAGSIPNGVRFVCSSAAHKSPAEANLTCAGDPVFEVPGTDAEVSRRLFVAGICGAIAATLLIEALFLGETSLSTGAARRWRRR